MTDQDGNKHISHEIIESYGLFNLPKSLMRNALMVYYDNAARESANDASTVRIFINLANSIASLPKQVAINFSRGPAYRRNMKMLRKYSK